MGRRRKANERASGYRSGAGGKGKRSGSFPTVAASLDVLGWRRREGRRDVGRENSRGKVKREQRVSKE